MLKAARDAGTKLFYIEDEHANVVQQVPQTLEYLGKLTI